MTETNIALPDGNPTASVDVPPAAPPLDTVASDEYPISPEGRRQAIVLLLGVASLWLFAAWSLVNLFEGGVGGIEWVSLTLMLGIVLVSPVVGWALLEEANSRFITGEEGIRYRSLMGIDLQYKWSELSTFETRERKSKVARFFLGDDDEDMKDEGRRTEDGGRELTEGESDAEDEDNDAVQPDTRLIRTPDRTGQINNPLARILHKLSHGASLPLYGGIERRDDLLRVILNSKS